MSVKLEICCGCAQDVIAADRAGADRVEFCAAMELGGLTPTAGMMAQVTSKTKIPIMAMVRPRSCGFCYTASDLEVMKADIGWLLENGASGVVFGVLTEDGEVDMQANAALMEAVREASGKAGRWFESVFHRAIDVTPNWKHALDQLINLGFTRVLTSGGAATALQGAQTIKEMIDYAAGRIEILPGAGINAGNAEEILKITGATQLHSTCSCTVEDMSCARVANILHFNAAEVSETQRKVTEPKKIKDLIDQIKN